MVVLNTWTTPNDGVDLRGRDTNKSSCSSQLSGRCSGGHIRAAAERIVMRVSLIHRIKSNGWILALTLSHRAQQLQDQEQQDYYPGDQQNGSLQLYIICCTNWQCNPGSKLRPRSWDNVMTNLPKQSLLENGDKRQDKRTRRRRGSGRTVSSSHNPRVMAAMQRLFCSAPSPLPFLPWHWTAGHHAAQHCKALNCTTLHCNVLRYTALYCATLHCTALHCTALR